MYLARILHSSFQNAKIKKHKNVLHKKTGCLQLHNTGDVTISDTQLTYLKLCNEHNYSKSQHQF